MTLLENSPVLCAYGLARSNCMAPAFPCLPALEDSQGGGWGFGGTPAPRVQVAPAMSVIKEAEMSATSLAGARALEAGRKVEGDEAGAGGEGEREVGPGLKDRVREAVPRVEGVKEDAGGDGGVYGGVYGGSGGVEEELRSASRAGGSAGPSSKPPSMRPSNSGTNVSVTATASAVAISLEEAAGAAAAAAGAAAGKEARGGPAPAGLRRGLGDPWWESCRPDTPIPVTAASLLPPTPLPSESGGGGGGAPSLTLMQQHQQRILEDQKQRNQHKEAKEAWRQFGLPPEQVRT
jgi:hypothetical protein